MREVEDTEKSVRGEVRDGSWEETEWPHISREQWLNSGYRTFAILAVSRSDDVLLNLDPRSYHDAATPELGHQS